MEEGRGPPLFSPKDCPDRRAATRASTRMRPTGLMVCLFVCFFFLRINFWTPWLCDSLSSHLSVFRAAMIFCRILPKYNLLIYLCFCCSFLKISFELFIHFCWKSHKLQSTLWLWFNMSYWVIHFVNLINCRQFLAARSIAHSAVDADQFRLVEGRKEHLLSQWEGRWVEWPTALARSHDEDIQRKLPL